MAAKDSDDEDFIYYGTAIEDEMQVQSLAHKPAVLDPGKTKAAPLHLQEPTDEQGRKRFHGAFTGGFSAGYFNTVGSKEGFEPATFKSSRSDRASVKQQSIESFMDEDEKQERGKTTLHVNPEYDTFGAAAMELARAQSQRDASARPSLIPGPAIADILAPTAESLGVQLLQKMGWRAGRGIVTAPTAPRGRGGGRGRAGRWGTVAGVSLESTPLYVLEPKQDLHGLDFDPFAGAEDFRELKQQREKAKQAELQRAAAAATSKLGMGGGAGQAGRGGPGKRPRGIAFGGVTDDSGMYGYMEDYVDDDEQPPTKQTALLVGKDLRAFDYELGSSGSEEDELPGKRRRPLLLEHGTGPPPLMLQDAAQLRKEGDFIPGFAKSDEQVVLAVYPAPQVPDDWLPVHTFPQPQQQSSQQQDTLPPPPEVPPPADPELRKHIDSLAAMVARSGPAVEQLARKQAQQQQQQQVAGTDSGSEAGGQAGDAKFGFLLGGEGALYYTWRLYKIKSALAAVMKAPAAAPLQQQQQEGRGPAWTGPLTVEQRMELLGEEALPATAAAQQALAKAEGLAVGARHETQEASKPQVAEGDKQRLQAALGSMFVKGSSQDMVAESDQPLGLRKGEKAPLHQSTSPPPGPAPATTAAASSATAAAVLASFGSRFTSASSSETLAARSAGLLQPTAGGLSTTTAAAKRDIQPKRWFEDWRPESLVCKRFNVPDPYKGKPLAPQMPKFKTDYIALPETSLGLGGLTAASGGETQAVQALPPPPPLPIDMAAAVARAAAIAQQLTSGQVHTSATAGQALPPPPPLRSGIAATTGDATQSVAAAAAVAEQPPSAPTEAKSYAASFLDSLTAGAGMFGAAASGAEVQAEDVVAGVKKAAGGAGQGVEVPGPAQAQDVLVQQAGTAVQDFAHTDASADFLSLDRPLDIFKAIFEADDDDEEEEQEAQPDGVSNATGAADMPQQPVMPAGVIAGGPGTAPTVGTTPQQQGLASALLQAQQLAKQRAQQAQSSQQQPSSQQAGPGPPLQPGLAASASVQGAPSNGAGQSLLAVDPEVQQRILAALAVMKKTKKKGKKDKDKKKKKSKHKKGDRSSDKERKSKKHSSKSKSGSKSKQKPEKTSSKKHRRSRISDDSSSDGSDSDDDDSTDSSSGDV